MTFGLFGKKGFTAISAFIILIAVLLIAVIASALITNASNELANDGIAIKQSIQRGERVVSFVEIAGYDASAEELTTFTVDLRLGLNSEPVQLEDITLKVTGSDFTSTLESNENGQNVNNISGYNTWGIQEFGQLSVGEVALSFAVDPIHESLPYTLPIDLDEDGTNDTVYTCISGSCPSNYDGIYLRFDLTSTSTDYYAPLIDGDGNFINISSAPVNLSVTMSPISGGWGFISLYGTTAVASRIGFGNETGTIFKPQEVIDADVDEDGLTDFLRLNRTHVIFDVSGESSDLSYALGADLSSPPVSFSGYEVTVSNGANRYGVLTIDGDTTSADIIPVAVNFTFTPTVMGRGFFYPEYLKRGDKFLAGRVSAGDVVRLHVESFRPIVDNEELMFSILSSDSDSSGKTVFTGHTMPAKYKYVLFPQI